MSFDRAVESAGLIPAEEAIQSVKKAYSELLSRELAFEIADLLRASKLFAGVSPRRPSAEVKPGPPARRLKIIKAESPEKYFLGGFGRKKLDVSVANEQDGLLFALSVKTITTRDKRSGNYNKNFKNRFGDLCAEATSVHMRSPYTYMVGLFAMPAAAAFDSTSKRGSTAERALRYLRSISGRASHEQSPEKFEMVVFLLFEPLVGDEQGTRYSVWDAEMFGSRCEPRQGRHRLFDINTMTEISAADLVSRLEQGFLDRNPFLEDSSGIS